jgi:hypothetical protein
VGGETFEDVDRKGCFAAPPDVEIGRYAEQVDSSDPFGRNVDKTTQDGGLSLWLTPDIEKGSKIEQKGESFFVQQRTPGRGHLPCKPAAQTVPQGEWELPPTDDDRNGTRPDDQVELPFEGLFLPDGFEGKNVQVPEIKTTALRPRGRLDAGSSGRVANLPGGEPLSEPASIAMIEEQSDHGGVARPQVLHVGDLCSEKRRNTDYRDFSGSERRHHEGASAVRLPTTMSMASANSSSLCPRESLSGARLAIATPSTADWAVTA